MVAVMVILWGSNRLGGSRWGERIQTVVEIKGRVRAVVKGQGLSKAGGTAPWLIRILEN